MVTVALDIGGTKILAGLVSGGRVVGLPVQCPTDARCGPDHVLSQCYALVDRLRPGAAAEAIGVASAGWIDVETGIVIYATPNLPGWTNLHLADLFGDRYNLPVVVENDVNAAALAEAWEGSGRDLDSLVCLMVGTGLGGAFVVDGQVWRGAHWSGAELGHTILKSGGRNCNCGLRGCSEQYVSCTALLRRYNELSPTKVESARDVLARLAAGDVAAGAALDEVSADLAELILSLRNAFDPEAFVIGGGFLSARDYWWDAVCRTVHAYDRGLMLLPSALGPSAPLIGVARLAEIKLGKTGGDARS